MNTMEMAENIERGLFHHECEYEMANARNIAKNLEKYKSNKQHLIDTFLGGELKISFPIQSVDALERRELVKKVSEYLLNKKGDLFSSHSTSNYTDFLIENYKGRAYHALYLNLSDSIFNAILDNKKLSLLEEVDVSKDSWHVVMSSCCQEQNSNMYAIMHLMESLLRTKSFRIPTFKSPKFTKQIRELLITNNAPEPLINHTLGVISEIQSFQPEAYANNELVISADPYDFITASENDYNWGSCISIGGDHFATTLSYMNDKYTLVAYVKSNKSEYLFHPEKTVSNKRLRLFIHFDTGYEGVALNKQYPVQSYQVEETLTKIIAQRLNINPLKYPPEAGLIYDETGYNDFGSDPIYPITEQIEELSFEIGESVYCLSCGDEMDENTQNETYDIFCNSCYEDDYIECSGDCEMCDGCC